MAIGFTGAGGQGSGFTGQSVGYGDYAGRSAPLLSQQGRIRLTVQDFTDEWKRYREQKQRRRGGTEARVLLNLCLYFGEHYATQTDNSIVTRATQGDKDKNKLHLVFNLTRKATRRKIGRIWGVDHQFYATPSIREPRAYDRADIVNNFIRGHEKILRQKSILWSKLFWMAVGGVAVEHTGWVPNVTASGRPAYDPTTNELLFEDTLTGERIPQSLVQQVLTQGDGQIDPQRFVAAEDILWEGEVGGDVYGPLNIFIDNAVKSIKELPPDQGVYIAEIKTKGWIRETFGTAADQGLDYAGHDLSIVSTRLEDGRATFANVNLRDLIPAVQGSRAKGDPEMCIFLTRYQPPHQGFPYGRRTLFIPDGPVLDDAAIPYEAIPLTDTHWEPRSTSFFSGDFITDLTAPQKFLNKRLSQLGEAANSSVYETLLLGPTLSEVDIPSDMPGVVPDALTPEGIPLIQPLQHAGLQGWFIESIRMVVDFMEHIGGTEGNAGSSKYNYMRGSMGIPMLQEIKDSEDGPFYEHLGEQEAEVRQKRVNRVKQYYPPQRTLQFTGADGRNEVMEFYTDDTLRAGFDFLISIDPASYVPELTSMREARIRERLSSPIGVALYTNRRTGQLDPSKIAHDLKYSDRNRESREEQARKLARQLVARIRSGEPLPPGIPLPTWEHDVMMDEYDAVFATMEFLEEPPQIRQMLQMLYEAQRKILTQIQMAASASIQNQMVQGAVAQATQQAAAQAAVGAVDAVMPQLEAQKGADQINPVENQVRSMVHRGQEQGAPGASGPQSRGRSETQGPPPPRRR